MFQLYNTFETNSRLIFIKITMPGRHPAQIGMKKAAAELAFFYIRATNRFDYEASRHRL